MPCPGVISTNSKAPGAYMACNTELYDNKTAYYLANHGDLLWVPSNIITMFSASNPIRINGGQWPFMFGRALIDGRYALGKVHAGNDVFGFYTFTSKGEVKLTSDFEVLTCKGSCRKFFNQFSF